MIFHKTDGKILLAGLLSTGLFMGCLSSTTSDSFNSSSTDAQALRAKGVLDDSTQWNKGGVGKVTICHIPPGNPANAHTISVGSPAVKAHLAHGDKLEACVEIIPKTPDCGKGGHHDSTGTNGGGHHDGDDSTTTVTHPPVVDTLPPIDLRS